MARYSLEERLQLINQQVNLMEALGIQLLEAKALITVAEGVDFSAHSQSLTRAYFWALNDVVEEATSLNERCLTYLCKEVDLSHKLH